MFTHRKAEHGSPTIRVFLYLHHRAGINFKIWRYLCTVHKVLCLQVFHPFEGPISQLDYWALHKMGGVLQMGGLVVRGWWAWGGPRWGWGVVGFLFVSTSCTVVIVMRLVGLSHRAVWVMDTMVIKGGVIIVVVRGMRRGKVVAIWPMTFTSGDRSTVWHLGSLSQRLIFQAVHSAHFRQIIPHFRVRWPGQNSVLQTPFFPTQRRPEITFSPYGRGISATIFLDNRIKRNLRHMTRRQVRTGWWKTGLILMHIGCLTKTSRFIFSSLMASSSFHSC